MSTEPAFQRVVVAMHVDAPPLTHNSHTCQRAASRVMPGAWTDYDTNPSEQDLLITYWASHPMACTRRSERTSYRFTQSSGRNATGIPQGHRKPLCAPSHSFARLEWKFNCRPQARWPEAHTQQPPPPSLCPLYAARPLLGPLPNAECPLSVFIACGAEHPTPTASRGVRVPRPERLCILPLCGRAEAMAASGMARCQGC